MSKLITRKEIDALYKKVGIAEQQDMDKKEVSNKLNTGTMHNRLSSSFNSKLKIDEKYN